MIALLLLALDASPSAAQIRDSETCYSINRMVDGETRPIGVTWQSVKHDRIDGVDVLRVVVHQRGAGGRFDMRDAFVLRADTLQPITFENTRSGALHVSLRYEDGRVVGRRIDDGVEKAVDVALPTPVWEGNLYGVMFAGLPLAEGATFQLPYYQYDKGVSAFDLRVTGSEVVATPEGPVDAWAVEVTTGADVRITYLIAREGGRELGYRGQSFNQVMGGDCSEITGAPAA
ncbi:MAG: hypothetical protein EON91_05150 [Brevundimonas sp.]|uniref:DUF3108 domain-containing protein n=1 Tax=Brevundimonas sp. TaxID=1871086 RepID=UPI001201D903|nr:hypothetical protein [Brevundimonas sp.]RZJ18499.1 MAG: hypothetical protein EON91_05150 [Brevundimonas sp.]